MKITFISLFTMLLLSQAAWSQSVLYNETFNYDGGGGTQNALDEGWKGIFANDTTNYLEIKKNNLGGGSAVNSAPINTAKGMAYMTETGSDFFMYTNEFKIDVSEVDRITFNSKIKSSTDVMRIAVRIGGEYYISTRGVLQESIKKKQTNSYRLHGTTWKLATSDGKNGISWSDLSPDIYLPSTGRIQRFGAYFEDVNGNIKVDNFSLMAVPEPATLALLALGALMIYLYKRNRPAEMYG